MDANMDTNSDANPNTPRPVRSIVRRGLGAAGAAVAVAFVGVAGLGAGQAQAAGVDTGPTYAAGSGVRPQPPSAAPTALPPASTLAVRYVYRDGRLIEL